MLRTEEFWGWKTTRHTNMTDFLALRSFKKFSAMKMAARSPLFFINVRGHPSQSFRPAGKHDRERKGNMAPRLNTKWNIQQRPNFTNKCILIASIFANKSPTFTKRHATSNFHSLLQSFCIKITRFDFRFFYLHFPLLFPLYFINLSLGTMDNIWYSSITLTAALKMSLQHHHISLRAGILPSTAPAGASSSHLSPAFLTLFNPPNSFIFW